MGTTTNYALPYPEPTGAVQPDVDLKALAQQTDTQMKSAISTPACKLVLPANFSLATTATAFSVPFPAGSVILDDLTWHSVTVNNTRITPNRAGRYLVIGNPAFAANATGDRRAYITKNGATSSVWARAIANGANSITVPVTGVHDMNGTTDYLELQGFQSSGGALDLLGAGDTTFSTSLTVAFLGSF